MSKNYFFSALLMLAFSLGINTVFGQSSTDSLMQLLNTPLEDTTRIQVMNKIAGKSFYKSPLLTDSLTTIAIALSQKTNNQEGEAYALKYKGISNAIRGKYEDARGYYERALPLFIELNNSKEIASTFYAIGITYSETGAYDQAEQFYKKALKQQKNSDDSLGIAGTYVGISGLFKNMSQLAKAVTYLDSAMYLYDLQNMEQQKSIAYNSMANIYLIWGNYPKALEATQNALKYNEANGVEQKMAINYHTLGTIYAHLAEYDLAMKYYQMSVDLKEKLGIVLGLALTIKNMGDTNLSLGNYELALNQFRRTMNTLTAVGQKCKIQNSQMSIGKIYLQKGMKDSARYYFNLVKTEGEICESLQLVAASNLELGRLSFESGDILLAKDLFIQAYQLAEEHRFKTTLIDAAEMLSALYKARNNYEKALGYLEKAKQISDSLYNEENDLEIARLESQYKFEKEKALLEEEYMLERIKQEAALEKEVFIRNAAISIALMVLFLGAVILYLFTKNKEKNKKLNIQNSQITQQNEKLEQLNTHRAKLLSILAHDLKSPLGSMLGIFTLIKLSELSEHEIERHSKDIEFSIRNLLDFLDNVLNWSNSSFSILPINKTELDIRSCLEEVVSMTMTTLNRKELTIEIRESVDMSLFVDAAMFKVVFRNLISNAIKFSHPKGLIILKWWKENDHVYISIQDFGLGMNDATKAKLFNETLSSQLGTNDEMGTGIGLYLSHDFLLRHDGGIEVISEPGEGSTFIVKLPLS
ncbi:MAG: tetratricopeptide repeat protein [Cyclobacteriaceae bacterium]